MQVETVVGCPWCGRRMPLAGSGKMIEHTPPGMPSVKCEGSFCYPWQHKTLGGAS